LALGCPADPCARARAPPAEATRARPPEIGSVGPRKAAARMNAGVGARSVRRCLEPVQWLLGMGLLYRASWTGLFGPGLPASPACITLTQRRERAHGGFPGNVAASANPGPPAPEVMTVATVRFGSCPAFRHPLGHARCRGYSGRGFCEAHRLPRANTGSQPSHNHIE
jgi:hypothetical protein